MVVWVRVFFTPDEDADFMVCNRKFSSVFLHILLDILWDHRASILKGLKYSCYYSLDLACSTKLMCYVSWKL